MASLRELFLSKDRTQSFEKPFLKFQKEMKLSEDEPVEQKDQVINWKNHYIYRVPWPNLEYHGRRKNKGSVASGKAQ